MSGIRAAGDDEPTDGGNDGDPCTLDSDKHGMPVEYYNEPDPCKDYSPGDHDRPAYCDNPCNTDDPILDNIGTQMVLEYLWEKSDADKPMEHRSEQSGFIVQNSNDELGSIEFPSDWPKNACGIGLPDNWLNSVPDNTIGYVHTHSFYEHDNTVSVCGDGPNTDDYQSGFSDEDFQTLVDMANHLSNLTIKGYMGDGNNVLSLNVFGQKSQIVGVVIR